AITVGEIDFGTASNIIITNSGGNALTLQNTAGNAIINDGSAPFSNTGTAIILAPVVATAATPLSIAVGGTNTLYLNGQISGAGGLTKTDTATLVLGAPNTYSGPTTVSQGTLRLVPAVAHYNLDGPGSTVNDSSGNGLNGSIVGPGTSFVAGQFGQALNFT